MFAFEEQTTRPREKRTLVDSQAKRRRASSISLARLSQSSKFMLYDTTRLPRTHHQTSHLPCPSKLDAPASRLTPSWHHREIQKCLLLKNKPLGHGRSVHLLTRKRKDGEPALYLSLACLKVQSSCYMTLPASERNRYVYTSHHYILCNFIHSK